MKKRLLVLVLVMVMCLGLVAPAMAVEIVDSGKCGDNLTWTLDSEGTLTISGTGDMWDFSNKAGEPNEFAPWGRDEVMRKAIFSVVIDVGVTYIGAHAFSGLDNLLSVKISEGVTEVGQYAFSSCIGLTQITIPDSVTNIKDGAFQVCSALTSINLPKHLTAIREYTFARCFKLSEIIVPEGVSVIGQLAFVDCTSLSTITIPASVTAIGMNPFLGCSSLSEIRVNPANTQYFSKDGVLYSSASNEAYRHEITLISYPAAKKDVLFTIPEGTVAVGSFFRCNNLTHITFSRTMTALGAMTLQECENLKSITIPDTVTYIDTVVPAFRACDNMSDIYYAGSKVQWEGIDKRPANAFEDLTIHYNSAGPDAQSAVSPSAPAFTDVSPDAYYAAPVAWAVGKEITSGTSATTFSPNQDCTNAQILTFLWRACGKPTPKISNPFTTDIPDAYLQAATWAYEQGMVSGSAFNANQPCTRAMAVTYIWQAAGSPAADNGNFIDVPDEADYAQAVAWAVENGVTSGTDNYVFSPNNVCSRGQIVTFLYRAMAGK